jgi:hypothetical protein
LIEAEDFIVEVEPIHNEVQPVSKADATLRIELDVRIEIDGVEPSVRRSEHCLLLMNVA